MVELRDGELVVRPWREQDAPAVYDACQDPELTTRALRLVSRYGLDELKLERLELITDPDNVGSQRVAEKVGFRHEGVLRSHTSSIRTDADAIR